MSVHEHACRFTHVRCRYPDLGPFWTATSMFCDRYSGKPYQRLGEGSLSLNPPSLARSSSLGMKGWVLNVLYNTNDTDAPDRTSPSSYQE